MQLHVHARLFSVFSTRVKHRVLFSQYSLTFFYRTNKKASTQYILSNYIISLILTTVHLNNQWD